MDMAQRTRSSSSPRATASYLIQLRPYLSEASGARQAMIRSLTSLADDIRRGGIFVPERANVIGRERIATFFEVRDRVAELTVPPSCEACHLTLGRWLDRLIDCCEMVQLVGRTGDVTYLHQAQALLMEAREYARGFNDEYGRIVQKLRSAVDRAAFVSLG